MASMDDVFERMQIFHSVLQQFQDSLQGSLADLEARHEEVNPYWNDESRRFYDIQYDPLHETLLDYVQRQGPEYLNYLEEKLRHLHEYLNG